MTALLAHYGHWVTPPRRQSTGPTPPPPWMPLPVVRSAQVVTSYRRRRIVAVKHRVVCGTMERVKQGLAAWNWQINTAFSERLHLAICQRMAAVGRRVNTLCQGKDGLWQQLGVCQRSHHFCLPHSSFRQPLLGPEPTNGSGSAQQWRPGPPAMAARFTDPVWALREVLPYRVPPWPPPQAL
jgi:hypothetical protein